MAKRDYYEILGVAKGATADEIKKAYRKVALQYHPDRNPGDKVAEDKFKEAAEAYEILSDEQKRAQYDRFGHGGVNGQGGFGGAGGGMNVEDIFENFGDIFGDFFGGGRGGGRSQKAGPPRGSNLRIKVKLTLEELANGAQKKVKVRKQVACHTCSGSGAKDSKSFGTCSTCNGSGQVRRVTQTMLGAMQTISTCPTCNGEGRTITNKCDTCKGSGVEYGDETISIDIPAGVSEGMQLSMSGKGNMGERGGRAGDLIIVIEELPHEYLQHEGEHILYDLYITFADAVLGTTVDIPTLDGKAKIKITPGTESGTILKLRNKGLPILNSYQRGDQLVKVKVWIPKSLNDEERKAVEKMRNYPNFQPRGDKSDKGFFDKVKDYFS
ncbi:MAG: molecular chaperone DnaJ [Sphingobacteriales bacterium]|nr:molecular chaperone DnaJ [Sphingobacteriales bacterium]